MLNRRLLRIKVMQALYALKQSEISNYHNAAVYIDEAYAPDLNAAESPDLKKLEANKKVAKALFEQAYKSGSPAADKESEHVLEVVHNAIDQYYNSNKKDQRHYLRLLKEDTEDIYSRYIGILNLIIELGDYALEYENEKKSRYLKNAGNGVSGKLFAENSLLGILRGSAELEKERARRNIKWPSSFVKKFYKEALLKDETFLEYLNSGSSDFEKDKKVVVYIAKNLIFKNKITREYFEEEDISWAENKSIISGLINKTFKEVSSPEDQLELIELSPNWEEDKEFFVELFERTLSNEGRLEEIISGKAENWDIERIASTDNVILKMALAEMLYFPSIPVKVTINEYIELSKIYSTPRSKKFINGLLDSLALELGDKGLIRKSGRGLIDNK
ncbi:transcription antitermination factor NusB [Cytophagaceae bacterium ABcell3]|nr:transcription antitermination factor NusB [Cytophagaceae bacterium ABcell3]